MSNLALFSPMPDVSASCPAQLSGMVRAKQPDRSWDATGLADHLPAVYRRHRAVSNGGRLVRTSLAMASRPSHHDQYGSIEHRLSVLVARGLYGRRQNRDSGAMRC